MAKSPKSSPSENIVRKREGGFPAGSGSRFPTGYDGNPVERFPAEGGGSDGADERTPEAPGVGYDNPVARSDNSSPASSGPKGHQRRHGLG
jgi:hypothetical protein